ncbi:hypothetical protein [Spiroplasma endosymbiont of Nebria brevicollis]|uniref:hypothetical protein n=1 Tax=Spiroplasma endosymbiont of Nebria brevicollis TaxID=3066284 RepID=UPI00313B3321
MVTEINEICWIKYPTETYNLFLLFSIKDGDNEERKAVQIFFEHNKKINLDEDLEENFLEFKIHTDGITESLFINIENLRDDNDTYDFKEFNDKDLQYTNFDIQEFEKVDLVETINNYIYDDPESITNDTESEQGMSMENCENNSLFSSSLEEPSTSTGIVFSSSEREKFLQEAKNKMIALKLQRKECKNLYSINSQNVEENTHDYSLNEKTNKRKQTVFSENEEVSSNKRIINLGISQKDSTLIGDRLLTICPPNKSKKLPPMTQTPSMKESSGKPPALASYNSGDATNVAELAQKVKEVEKLKDKVKLTLNM